MAVTRLLRPLGSASVGLALEVGSAARMFGKIIVRTAAGQCEASEFKRMLFKMGYQSVGLILATSVVVGVILVIQSFAFVDRYGMRTLIGWGAGFVIVRELGPVLFALMFSGRVGAFTAAELGTMKVTDQIDGLRCLAISPISYLIVPRFWAMIVSLTVLTILGNAGALLTASVVGQIMMDVEQHTFWNGFSEMLAPMDFISGIIKAASFGAIVALASCHAGLQTSGGAPGVGLAVNRAVVSSAVSIFLVDYFSTFVLG